VVPSARGRRFVDQHDSIAHLTCRRLPPFFEHKHRLVYSYIEKVATIDEIKHPPRREVLRFMDIPYGVEIHHDGDLPARSGMGTSSAFTVACCRLSMR